MYSSSTPHKATGINLMIEDDREDEALRIASLFSDLITIYVPFSIAFVEYWSDPLFLL